LIFDTFAKLVAAGGGDEDKAKDQGKVFANIQRIKERMGRPGPGPHVALVGHTGKDETRGSRGSNAILGDADVMVTISGDEIKTATVTKANDMPEGPLFSFKSETHDFGTDEDGDPITVNIVSSERRGERLNTFPRAETNGQPENPVRHAARRRHRRAQSRGLEQSSQRSRHRSEAEGGPKRHPRRAALEGPCPNL
jgi:hypothetical protein